MPVSSIPPHQTGMPRSSASVMHGDCLAEATDTADLDVDDAAGLHGDGGERVAAIADGFVETDMTVSRRFCSMAWK